MEGVGIAGYRGRLLVAANVYQYDSTAKSVVRNAQFLWIIVETGEVEHTLNLEGWEVVAIQQGMSGLEGCSAVIKWISGTALGPITPISPAPIP